MYLILESKAAKIRNVVAAMEVNCDIRTTSGAWNEIALSDGRIALDVEDGKINGEQLLSNEELAACVDVIPTD